MNIAVTADGQTLSDSVSSSFDTCRYLLIVNMSDMHINAISNEADCSEEYLAQTVIEADCEVIITGTLKPSAFDLFMESGITRYYGFGHSVEKAIELMNNYGLKLIRNYEGIDVDDNEYD